MKLTLRLYQAIQATSEDLIAQNYSRQNQCVRVALSNNKPEV